jgi:hypothetical protein
VKPGVDLGKVTTNNKLMAKVNRMEWLKVDILVDRASGLNE